MTRTRMHMACGSAELLVFDARMTDAARIIDGMSMMWCNTPRTGPIVCGMARAWQFGVPAFLNCF